MDYISVCSGIEAATVAWHPLGWRPRLFAEIDKFPSRVLANHYPEVRNIGDFTRITKAECGSGNIDLLVGGTPCQDFSIAGFRAGLAGERGNLTLQFLELIRRIRPRWVVWENVPGVYSAHSHTVTHRNPIRTSRGGRRIYQTVEADEAHAFANFLAGFQELGYGFAYRTLDAQYFGVPQRRRRVFVVGYLGAWQRAAAVLFERQSLCGYPPPRREAGQNAAPTISARTQGGGGLGTDFDCDGGVILDPSHRTPGGIFDEAISPALSASGRGTSRAGDSRGQDALIASTGDISHCLNAGGQGRQDYETETLIVGGFPSSDIAPTLNAGGNKTGVNRFYGTSVDTCDSLVPMAIQGAATRENPDAMAVRRLTPRECERLQGFPDDYTLITPSTADGPRYKALGNSMAVPVMRWIGERISQVDALSGETAL